MGLMLSVVKRQAPSTCPVCAHSLRITRLECDSCHTAIEGDFDSGPFGKLSREHLAFALVFLECRGKIKDVEERLGLSYPTVVSRLEQVVSALTAKEPAEPVSRIDDILDAVASGKVSAKDAASRLKRNKKQ